MKRIEMIGKRFGRLVVTRLSENTSGKRKRLMYYCDCDCGRKDVEIVGEKLRAGTTRSCGCLVKEVASTVHKKYNRYDLSSEEYGIGFASNTSRKFYFDLEDYDKIKGYCWLEMANGYIGSKDENQKYVYLHRLVMNAKEGEIVDHKKHDPSDNRKEFLRIGSQSKNMMNTSLRKDNTSETTGVYFCKNRGRWSAEIQVNKRKVYLGLFNNKTDAIAARKKAEEKYFKDWSYKNSVGKDNNAGAHLGENSFDEGR